MASFHGLCQLRTCTDSRSWSKRFQLVRRPRAHKVDHSKFTFTSPSKRKTVVAWAEYLPKSPDLFVCQCRPGPFGQTVEFFLSPSSCTSCYGNQVDACDQGFVSTMLWLKFRSNDTHHASGASVRLPKTPQFDWDGGCRSRCSWTVGSIQRARSWEVSVARRPCPPRPDVRRSPRQYWRCYFNVQRYL